LSMPSTKKENIGKNTAAAAHATYDRAASPNGNPSVAARSSSLGRRPVPNHPSARFQLTVDHHASNPNARIAKTANAATSGPQPCDGLPSGATTTRYKNTNSASHRFPNVQ